MSNYDRCNKNRKERMVNVLHRNNIFIECYPIVTNFVDIDECENEPSKEDKGKTTRAPAPSPPPGKEKLCSHICVNTPGSYQCDCPGGMVLSKDDHNCIGKGVLIKI